MSSIPDPSTFRSGTRNLPPIIKKYQVFDPGRNKDVDLTPTSSRAFAFISKSRDHSRSGNLYPRHTSHVNVRALFSEKLFECHVGRDGTSVCKRTSEWTSVKVSPVSTVIQLPSAVTRVFISATMTVIFLAVNFDVILKVLVHCVTIKVITGPRISRKSNQHSTKANLLREL